jgi:hypothetical protein
LAAGLLILCHGCHGSHDDDDDLLGRLKSALWQTGASASREAPPR